MWQSVLQLSFVCDSIVSVVNDPITFLDPIFVTSSVLHSIDSLVVALALFHSIHK